MSADKKQAIVYNPGSLFKWDDILVEAISINYREKSIGFQTVRPEDGEHCPHCRKFVKPKSFHIIESSPLFQENAKPVETLGEE